MSQLPPLPEPSLHEGITVNSKGKYASTEDGYTEAQVLAYRDAVVEACAQLMEEQDTQQPKHNAKAIRSLLK